MIKNDVISTQRDNSISEKYITPQDFLSWGVFCKNCGTINKEEYCCFNHIIIMLYLF